MNPVETLKAVLCGQDGKCCIAGSEADRKVVDEALAALDTAQPAQVNAMLVEALEQAHDMVDHWGCYASDYFQEKNDFAGDKAKIKAALTAAKQAQPEPDLNKLLAGKLVSMDVSTGEDDAFNRVFGRVCEVMLESCGAQEDTILAIEESRNFEQAQPARPINCGTGHCSCIECPYEQAQPERAPVVWPKERDIGRFGDMSPSAHLRVGLDTENDAYVSVFDENGGGTIEFCSSGGGGGKSSRTRLALVALMVAMEADNAECPELDWWARRRGIKQGGQHD